jgi:hypothetical protein
MMNDEDLLLGETMADEEDDLAGGTNAEGT